MNYFLAFSGEVIWRPVAAPAHILAFAAGLALLAALVYARTLREHPWRSAWLLTMRWAIIAALAAIQMGPSSQPPQATEPGRGMLVVLLDTSGSMSTEDCGEQTRLGYAVEQWLDPQKLARLEASHDLRFIGFDEASRAMAASSLELPAEQLISGRSTNYAQALGEALAGLPAMDSTILLMGDGHDSEQRPLASAISAAKQRGVPVYTVAVGSSRSVRDLALVAVPRQEFLMSGETGQIMATIHQVDADEATTTLRLRGEGNEKEHVVHFGGRASVMVELPIQPQEPGVHEYTVSAEPIDGETVTANNSQSVFVEVTAKRIRLLLLEGEPYWDTKFLAQALRNDPRIEVLVVAQVAADKSQSIVTRSEQRNATVPQTAEQFAEFDVVVLGRGIEKLLPADAAGALAEYVSSGAGHVILARGRPYDPDTPAGQNIARQLAALEPATWAAAPVGATTGQPLSLTSEGLSHPAFAFAGLADRPEQIITALPPLTGLVPVASLKPATQILATAGPSDPAIVSMRYGSGQVFAVLGEGLWQWSLLPPSLSKYKGAFDSLWSNAVRGLALGGEFQPGQDVSLRLGRTSLRLGDEQVLEMTLKVAAPPAFAPKLRLIGPDGETSAAELHPLPGLETRYTATFRPDQVGDWTAALEVPPLSPTRQLRRFSVYELNVERLRTDARPHVLRDLAEQTGGEFFTADQEIDLAQRLHRQRVARMIPPKLTYLWDRSWLLAVLVTWMGLEWIARRRSGWL